MNEHYIPSIPQRALVRALAMSFPAGLWPLTGFAQVAASVDYASPGVMVSSPGGAQRPLAKGQEISSGDTVITGPGARAYLRFIDGQQMAIQPATTMKLQDYRYTDRAQGQGNVAIELARGGLRAITGLIGKARRSDYQISTPTATVGIRGTEPDVSVDDQGNFRMNCGYGGCDVTDRRTNRTESINSGETLVLGNNGSGFDVIEKIALQSAPRQPDPRSGTTSAQNSNGDGGAVPDVPVPPTSPFVRSDQLAADGTIKKLADAAAPTNASTPAGNMTLVGVNAAGPTNTLYSGSAWNVTTSGAQVTAINGVNAVDGKLYDLQGTSSQSLIDGGIRLGVWSSFSGTQGGSAYSGSNFAYATGAPSTTFPLGESTVSYQVSMSTTPVASGSSWSVNLDTSNTFLRVDFAASTMEANLAFNASSGYTSTSFTANSSSVPRSGAAFGQNGISVLQGSCNAGTASIRGFFSGSNAGQAASIYLLNTTLGPGTVKGAISYVIGSDPRTQ